MSWICRNLLYEITRYLDIKTITQLRRVNQVFNRWLEELYPVSSLHVYFTYTYKLSLWEESSQLVNGDGFISCEKSVHEFITQVVNQVCLDKHGHLLFGYEHIYDSNDTKWQNDHPLSHYLYSLIDNRLYLNISRWDDTIILNVRLTFLPKKTGKSISN